MAQNFANNLIKLTDLPSPIGRILLCVMVLEKVPEWFSLTCIKHFFFLLEQNTRSAISLFCKKIATGAYSAISADNL